METTISLASGVGAGVSQVGAPYSRPSAELTDQGTPKGAVSSAALALLQGTLAAGPGVPGHDLDVLA